MDTARPPPDPWPGIGTRTYRLLDLSIRITGPSWVLPTADDWLGHVATTEGMPRAGDGVVELLVEGTPDSCWLRLEGERTPPVSLASLRPWLRWLVQREVRSRTTGLVLHAAMLGRPGGALLLLGDSGAGKSTLTAALACSGWSALGDEIAVVDADGRVRAALTPAALRLSGVAALRECGLATVPPRPAPHGPMRVRWAVLPAHDPTQSATAQALGPAELIIALLHSAGRADARGLARAQAVATGVKAWRVIAPDPRGAVAAIHGLVDGAHDAVVRRDARVPDAEAIPCGSQAVSPL